MKATDEQLDLFFVASRVMSKKVLQIPKKETPYGLKDWQYRISPKHLSEIFSWIHTNRTKIEADLREPPHAIFFDYEETKLYLSFELVIDPYGQTNLFLSTKSKLASFSTVKLKEKELTDLELEEGQKKSKVIGSGSFKEVQYCFQWRPGMRDLAPYAVGVVSRREGIDEIKSEEKYGQLIGENYTNPGLSGVKRKKFGKVKVNFYSPLAIADQCTWSEDKGEKGMINMDHLQFLTVLYKQALILVKLQQLGIIWRDLKGENFLLKVGNSKDSIKPLAIDFSYARRETDDKNALKNDFGSLPYVSPWSDIYSKIREYKLEELMLFTKLRQIPENSSRTRARIEAEIRQWQMAFRIAAAQITRQYPECADAINSINCYQNPRDLKPSTFSEDWSLKFLSSHLDDVWAFSKLMTQIIGLRRQGTPDKKFDGELKNLHDYFKENMKKPWRDIHTGEVIVKNLEEFFKQVNIRVDYRPPQITSPVAFLSSKKKKDAESRAYVRLPGRF